MRAATGYEALVLIVVGLILITTALLAELLLHHARVSWRIRRSERRRGVLLPAVCRAICDPAKRGELLAGIRASDRRILLPLLVQLALDLRGDELKEIARLAEELGIADEEQRRLRSRRAATRAEAVKNLGLLRVEKGLPTLLHLLTSDPRTSVRLSAVWALGEVGGRRAALGLLAMLEDPVPAVVRRAQEVLLQSAPDAAAEIVSYVRRSDVAQARRAAVEVLGALRDPIATPLLLELLDDEDVELRIKAAKASAAVADPRCLETFCRLLGDPLWQVRCQAANGLGTLGDGAAAPRLWEALADEAWWVRFNAATALHELGPAGRQVLSEAARHPDRLRQEVARYVLERSAAVGVAA